MFGRLDDYENEIYNSKCKEDVLSALKRQIKHTGFDYFAMQAFQENGSQPFEDFTTYPQEWVTRYNNKGYIRYDMITYHSACTVMPFLWSDVQKTGNLTSDQKLVFEEASDFGLRSGGTVPLFGPKNLRGLFSISTSMPSKYFNRHFTRGLRHELQLVSCLAYERLYQIGSLSSVIVEGELTPKEKEILTWFAGGKTIWEVSALTCIAEPTVRHHLKNAIAGLNALNKTHAVVLAQKRGLIHIE